MTGGAKVSARERGRTRAREQAMRMGHDAGPRGRERASASALRAGRSAGPSRRKEGESARVEFCFSFSKCK
jgi:hypothetical protein